MTFHRIYKPLSSVTTVRQRHQSGWTSAKIIAISSHVNGTQALIELLKTMMSGLWTIQLSIEECTWFQKISVFENFDVDIFM